MTHIRIAASLQTLLMALLVGCGPTTGGTGGGGSALVANGASALSLCSATFAPALNCFATSLAPATPQQLAGTAAVHFAADSARGPFVLTFEGNTAELQSRCQAGRFEGAWGARPGEEARFFGDWTGAGGGAPLNATLVVMGVAASVPTVQVSVLAADGTVMLGPLPMQRTETRPSGTPSCP